MTEVVQLEEGGVVLQEEGGVVLREEGGVLLHSVGAEVVHPVDEVGQDHMVQVGVVTTVAVVVPEVVEPEVVEPEVVDSEVVENQREQSLQRLSQGQYFKKSDRGIRSLGMVGKQVETVELRASPGIYCLVKSMCLQRNFCFFSY